MQLVKQQNVIKWATNKEQETAIMAFSNGKMISSLSEEEKIPIISLLGRWRYYIGVTSDVPDDEFPTLEKFISKHYGFLKIDEINLAIDLSLTGKLGDVQTRAFNTFSVLYVSSILNAYLAYKDKLFKAIKARQDNVLQIEYQKVPDPKERCEEFKEIVLGEYKKWKEQGSIQDYFCLIYNYLEKTGQAAILKEDAKEITKRALTLAREFKSKTGGFKTIGQAMTSMVGANEEQLYTMFGKNLCTEYIFSKIEDINKFVETIIPDHFK